jgi:toxin FitB
MYLLDTNVISEARKGDQVNTGVKAFFQHIILENIPVYISVITIGELRRGVDLISYRGDLKQARILQIWLESILVEYKEYILNFDCEIAQLWGRLRVPCYENALDKQIAATAIIYDLTVVTRNSKDFVKTGVKVHNPFN